MTFIEVKLLLGGKFALAVIFLNDYGESVICER